MKIHIIGGSGTGKTYLARRLAQAYGLTHYDLDEIFCDDRSRYGQKRAPQERDALLAAILEKDNWIIEGVYYAWCGPCFSDADRIYLLTAPRPVYRFRILRRFLRRKLGLEAGKQESLKSLFALLKWADKYQEENMVQIRKALAPYADKVIEGRSSSIDISNEIV